VNVAEVAPEATVTEPGVVSRLLLSDSVTTVLPVGAAWLSTAVQDALPPVLRVAGVHDNDVNVGATIPPGPVTTPPVADTAIAVPLADAAVVLLTPMEVVTTPAAIVKFTVATTPLAIVVEFKPYATQVYAPVLLTQLNVLLAFVSAAPAVADMEVTFAAGKARVH
jgi:hypothetical protein